MSVRTGLYGDLAGTLRQAQTEPCDGVVIALEWPDLDPRLGIRQLGGWAPELLPEIAEEAGRRLALIAELAVEIASKTPVVVSLPGLPLAPAAFQPSRQQSPLEAALTASLAHFSAELTAAPGVTMASPRELDRISPAAGRHDVKAELSSGFPYQMAHASALGELLSQLLVPPAPRKGLITDLDDTLWHGILGDDGVSGVTWDQEHHAAAHGYYQQILQSLARTGVLVGVASKNSPAIVAEALARPDLLVGAADLFPVEAGWGPKSEAVSRILRAWNIGADSVVFIDDSPMELEEVGRSHPGMECILFPKQDAAAVYQLGYRLRDLFGKSEVREEDRIRGQSLRANQAVQEASGAADMETFLREARGELTQTWLEPPFEPRVLELINKTNQFNVNGRRYGEAEWRDWSARPETAVLQVEYRDKYGPLGKIGVLAGTHRDSEFQIETWVLSCRAFSRRIEHHMLLETLDRWAVDQVAVEYQPTERNGPAGEFFATLLDTPPAGRFVLSREQFTVRCPPLYHSREAESAVTK
ncbi:MAG: HAD-IIIC family phosphatase [Bryobacterales bacterium]|nr:HAD-IIIC family phosphatase [Bryobacterales bacterium]